MLKGTEMNERIKELVKSAEVAYEKEDILLSLVLEKFAELIVKECAELCDINDQEQGDILREHFGVE
jgi:hypothetical protein